MGKKMDGTLRMVLLIVSGSLLAFGVAWTALVALVGGLMHSGLTADLPEDPFSGTDKAILWLAGAWPGLFIAIVGLVVFIVILRKT